MSRCLRTVCQSGQQRSLAAFEHGISNLNSRTVNTSIAPQVINRQYVRSNSSACSSFKKFKVSNHLAWWSSLDSRPQVRCLSTTTGYASISNTDNTPVRPNPPNKSPAGRASSRSILITGGTSGIGFAVARQAVLEGASHVRIITRDAQRGQAAIDQLRKHASTDTELDHVVANADEYADSKLFQTNTNPITTVIHSAGITQTSHLPSTPSAAIKHILSINLESAALVSKAHLKRYMQTCVGRQQPPTTQTWQVVNVSSLLALKGGAGASVYAASKAGLIALTRATALEGAEIARRYAGAENALPRFRANVVVPGYIETPMTNGISGSSREKLLREIPTGRFGTPEEVADAVMFLLGNEYANNCVLNLDGGLSAT